jgi:hypothetical protein
MCEAVIYLFALQNVFIMLRSIYTIVLNYDLSLTMYLFNTGILSMVPYRIASVRSWYIYVCATKYYDYANKQMYNYI